MSALANTPTEGRTKTAMMRRLLKVMLPTLGVLALSSEASAQEIQLTGPLAGAPAVRNLRQHRKGRVELAPAVSFTLLDEYQRTIFAGARINYNITDWLAIGVWGAYGAVHAPTGLSDKIQSTNDTRFTPGSPDYATPAGQTGRRLTAINVGKDFKEQLGKMNWVVAPQITAVPFRGKLAIFQKIFVDTDAYFFAGAAFVNVTEREDCGDGKVNCSQLNTDGTVKTKGTASRMAIAPTFGLGLSFYTGKWTSFGLEWRALPFKMNTGGFDTRGGDPDEKFPDNKVTDKDREFKFNQMITVSFGFYLPTDMKVSE
jgi:outer membrane beta-barrel protein